MLIDVLSTELLVANGSKKINKKNRVTGNCRLSYTVRWDDTEVETTSVHVNPVYNQSEQHALKDDVSATFSNVNDFSANMKRFHALPYLSYRGNCSHADIPNSGGG